MSGRIESSLGACAILIAWAAGCGSDGSEHHVDASRFPLVAGARLVATVDDPPVTPTGNNDYTRWLVVSGRRYLTSAQLLAAELRLLRTRGWRRVRFDRASREWNALSPDRRVELEMATAQDALRGYYRGCVQSVPRCVTLPDADGAHFGKGITGNLLLATRRRTPAVAAGLRPHRS